MKKLNPFKQYSDLETRNAQIIYLHNECGMGASEISTYVSLAVSTIRGYIYKFAHLLEKAKEMFAVVKETILNAVRPKEELDNIISYDCEHKVGDCAYIIEYFDSQKRFVFLKVGMTNNIGRRVGEHLRYYTQKGWDTTYAVIKKIYYAEDEEDALTLENLLRKHYKQIPNGDFIKRDRFANVRYNINELIMDTDLMKKVELFAI